MNQRTSVQCSKTYFFSQFLAKFFAKIVLIYFFIFSIFYKNENKEFESPKSIRNYEKDNAWNIRRLVTGSFVQTNQQPRILYCKLTDFRLNRNGYKKNSLDFCCFTIKIDSALELGCFKHTLVLFDVTAPSMLTFST